MESSDLLSSLSNLGVTNDSRLLVAVSGGPDSIALAYAVRQLFRDHDSAKMAVAHVNHQLRGKESGADEAFVKEYCEKWDVKFYSKKIETKKVAEDEKTGIEETARKIRYEFFEEIMREHGFDIVLTAHTANDQAETVLMNIMRGAGVRGLAGIPPKRKLGKGYIFRPWLHVTREEIREYLAKHNLTAREDSSNSELTFRRNQVRHRLIPELQTIWPDRSAVQVISDLASRMREFSNTLSIITKEKLAVLELEGGLALSEISKIEPVLFHDLLEAWIHTEFGHYGLTSEESERVLKWLHSASPRTELRRGLSLRKDGNILRLESDGRY